MFIRDVEKLYFSEYDSEFGDFKKKFGEVNVVVYFDTDVKPYAYVDRENMYQTIHRTYFETSGS